MAFEPEKLYKYREGIVIIINNYNLTNIERKDDSSRLKDAFTAGFNFEVHTEDNISASQMLQVFKMRRPDDVIYRCFVCVISSRGHDEIIYGSDRNGVSINACFKILESSREWFKIPKLFFIDACGTNGGGFVMHKPPRFPDYYICYSALADKRASMEFKGSPLFKDLIDKLSGAHLGYMLDDLSEDLKVGVPKISNGLQKVEIHTSLSGNFELYDCCSLIYTPEKQELYPVSSPKTGYAIFFNNYRFDDSLKDLEGGEEDTRRIKTAFRKLNFDVQIMENLSAFDMLEMIDLYASSKTYEEYGCFACVISSHGNEESILGKDGNCVRIDDFINNLGSCKTLVKKPKFFFIDACRTNEADFVVRKQPRFSDYCICYATLAGSTATMMGNTQWKGSIFLKILSDTLRTHGRDCDFKTLANKLKHGVSKLSNDVQKVEIQETLSKIVVFTEGWHICDVCSESVKFPNRCKGCY